jgi:hypothetical protein
MFDMIDLRAVPSTETVGVSDSVIKGTQVGFVTYQTTPETPLAPLRGRIIRNDSNVTNEDIKLSFDFGVGIAASEPITHCYMAAQNADSKMNVSAYNGIHIDNLPSVLYQVAFDMGPAGDGVGGRIIGVTGGSSSTTYLVEIDPTTLIWKRRTLPTSSRADSGAGFVEWISGVPYYFYLDYNRYIKKLNLNTMTVEATSANIEYVVFSDGNSAYSPQNSSKSIRVYSLEDLTFTTTTASGASGNFSTSSVFCFYDKRAQKVMVKSTGGGAVFQCTTLSDYLTNGLDNLANFFTNGLTGLAMVNYASSGSTLYEADKIFVCPDGNMWGVDVNSVDRCLKKFYIPALGGSAQFASCVAFDTPIDNTAPDTALRLDIVIHQTGTLMDLSL